MRYEFDVPEPVFLRGLSETTSSKGFIQFLAYVQDRRTLEFRGGWGETPQAAIANAYSHLCESQVAIRAASPAPKLAGIVLDLSLLEK